VKIVIIGPGAMGCLFGGFLSLSGQEVWFLDKDPERARILQEQGISIEGISGEHKAQVKASSEAKDISGADLVIIYVKSYDTAASVENIENIVGPKTPVLTLQNGLGNAEIISQNVGAQKTLGGVTSQGATLLGIGHIRHAGQGPTVMGWAAKAEDDDFDQDSILKEIMAVFEKAGFQTKTADKCTWCYHRITKGLKPACVQACPSGARLFGDVKKEDDPVRKILATERIAVLQPEKLTKPSCYYLGYDKEVR